MKNDQKGCLKCYPFEKWIQNGDQCVQCQGENGIGIEGCLKCEVSDGEVECIRCKSGYSLVQGMCRACLQGCLECNEKQDCLSCDSGYRKNYQVCEKCRIANCMDCKSNQDQCEECNEGYFTWDHN